MCLMIKSGVIFPMIEFHRALCWVGLTRVASLSGRFTGSSTGPEPASWAAAVLRATLLPGQWAEMLSEVL